MRRRRPVGSNLPAALSPEALPEWRDNTTASPRRRKAAWDAWMLEFEAWREARRTWAERNRLDPDAMSSESHLIPDMPFDPSEV